MRPVLLPGWPGPILVDDDKPTFWARLAAGLWEPGLLSALRRLVRPGTTLLDLGAWVGPVALGGAALGARVVAVEADPAAQRQLRRNLAANPDLARRIVPIAKAVSATPGPVRLGSRRKPGDSMSSTLLSGSRTTWDAEAVTPAELDGLLGPAPDLVVKIDIEGGEYGLLPGLAPVLQRRRPALILSLHPAILRQSGVADPAAAAEAILAPVRDWSAYRLDGAAPEASRLAAALAEPDSCDTWLFLPPGRDLPADPAALGAGIRHLRADELLPS